MIAVACRWAAVLAAVLALSYGLAILGEPRALWVWRDVLGLMP